MHACGDRQTQTPDNEAATGNIDGYLSGWAGAHLQVERVLVPFQLQQSLLHVGQPLQRVVGLRPVAERSYVLEWEVIPMEVGVFTCKIHKNRIPRSGLGKARGPWRRDSPGVGRDSRCSCSGRARCRRRCSPRRRRSRCLGCPRRNRRPRRCTICRVATRLRFADL